MIGYITPHTNGLQMTPKFAPSTYMDRTWSFDEASDHCYMLSYVLVGYDRLHRGFPEVQPPEASESELEREVNNFLKNSRVPTTSVTAGLGDGGAVLAASSSVHAARDQPGSK